jgi:hypothetical protein
MNRVQVTATYIYIYKDIEHVIKPTNMLCSLENDSQGKTGLEFLGFNQWLDFVQLATRQTRGFASSS